MQIYTCQQLLQISYGFDWNKIVVIYAYSTLNKITQFWLVKSSTINPK